jgi:hypothetical protein
MAAGLLEFAAYNFIQQNMGEGENNEQHRSDGQAYGQSMVLRNARSPDRFGFRILVGSPGVVADLAITRAGRELRNARPQLMRPPVFQRALLLVGYFVLYLALVVAARSRRRCCACSSSQNARMKHAPRQAVISRNQKTRSLSVKSIMFIAVQYVCQTGLKTALLNGIAVVQVRAPKNRAMNSAIFSKPLSKRRAMETTASP